MVRLSRQYLSIFGHCPVQHFLKSVFPYALFFLPFSSIYFMSSACLFGRSFGFPASLALYDCLIQFVLTCWGSRNGSSYTPNSKNQSKHTYFFGRLNSWALAVALLALPRQGR